MAGSLLPLASALCFVEFNATFPTFSRIHYVQIIHNASTKHDCLDDILKRIHANVAVRLTSDAMPREAAENFVVFYSDIMSEDKDNLRLAISRDLRNFPSYSHILIVHSNQQFDDYSLGIIRRSFEELVLSVTILCAKSSNNFTRMSSPRSLESWCPTLRKETVRVALFNYEPMVYFSSEKGLYAGIEKNILEQITSGWNISFVEHEPNTWELIHKDIVEGKADIGICGFWRDSIDYKKVDMSKYYAMSCNTFVVPKPKLIPLSPVFLLQSFHYTLYIILLLTMIVVTILVHYLHKNDHDFGRHFLEVYRITIMMSASTVPHGNTLRYIFCVWCLCAILVNVFHTAGLTKRLSFPRFTHPVNTFADMHKQNTKWLLKSPSIIPLINSSHDVYKQTLMDLLVGNDTVGVDDFLINYAEYASPVNIVERYVDIPIDIIEKLAEVAKPLSECLSENYYVFAIKKNSPIRRIFDNKLSQIAQAGLVHAWILEIKRKFYKELKLMPVFYQTYPDFEDLRVLTMRHLQGAFLILIVGHVISILILIKEIYF